MKLHVNKFTVTSLRCLTQLSKKIKISHDSIVCMMPNVHNLCTMQPNAASGWSRGRISAQMRENRCSRGFQKIHHVTYITIFGAAAITGPIETAFLLSVTWYPASRTPVHIPHIIEWCRISMTQILAHKWRLCKISEDSWRGGVAWCLPA